jgi:hypothetical protein
MKQAEDGVLDLNKAADTLNVGILPNAECLLLCFEKAQISTSLVSSREWSEVCSIFSAK